jgi:hypothetical protein
MDRLSAEKGLSRYIPKLGNPFLLDLPMVDCSYYFCNGINWWLGR